MLAWSFGKEFVLCLQMPVLRVSMCVCVRACVRAFSSSKSDPSGKVFMFELSLGCISCVTNTNVRFLQHSSVGVGWLQSVVLHLSAASSSHYTIVRCVRVCKEHRLCFNYDVKQLHLNDTVSHARTHATSFHCATALHNAVLFLPSSTS